VPCKLSWAQSLYTVIDWRYS